MLPSPHAPVSWRACVARVSLSIDRLPTARVSRSMHIPARLWPPAGRHMPSGKIGKHKNSAVTKL